MTTGPSEVDPVVLAGEPDGARQLEGGDDDLAVTREQAEWADVDGIVDAPPTPLGQ